VQAALQKGRNSAMSVAATSIASQHGVLRNTAYKNMDNWGKQKKPYFMFHLEHRKFFCNTQILFKKINFYLYVFFLFGNLKERGENCLKLFCKIYQKVDLK